MTIFYPGEHKHEFTVPEKEKYYLATPDGLEYLLLESYEVE